MVTARSVDGPRIFSATFRQCQVLFYRMFLLLKPKDLFYTTELCISHCSHLPGHPIPCKNPAGSHSIS